MSTSRTSTLHNGVKIPLIGLGTYKMVKENVEAAIPAALEQGYRLFDTATIYKNEQFVGETLNNSLERLGIKREEIFVTSKLQPADQGYEATIKAVDLSLSKLKLGYIDMYLIHWPGVGGLDPKDPKNKDLRKESWKALEDCYKQGKLKAIGVSNYTVNHLKEMKEYAQVLPMANQFELHPLCYPTDVVKHCEAQGIFVQAYSSLGKGKLVDESFISNHPKIVEMLRNHNITASQLFLKWPIQHGWGILPKSNSSERIKVNSDLENFELSTEEMNYLDDLHNKEAERLCWDPNTVI